MCLVSSPGPTWELSEALTALVPEKPTGSEDAFDRTAGLEATLEGCQGTH